jgi:hypothetical protein
VLVAALLAATAPDLEWRPAVSRTAAGILAVRLIPLVPSSRAYWRLRVALKILHHSIVGFLLYTLPPHSPLLSCLGRPSILALALVARQLLLTADALSIPFRWLLPLQLAEALVSQRLSTCAPLVASLPQLCEVYGEAISMISGFGGYQHWLQECSGGAVVRRTALALHLFLAVAAPGLVGYLAERRAKAAWLRSQQQQARRQQARRQEQGQGPSTWSWVQLCSVLLLACYMLCDAMAGLMLWLGLAAAGSSGGSSG